MSLHFLYHHTPRVGKVASTKARLRFPAFDVTATSHIIVTSIMFIFLRPLLTLPHHDCYGMHADKFLLRYSNGSNGYSNGYGGGYGSSNGYGGSNGYSGGYGGGGFGGGDKMSSLGAGLKTQHWGKVASYAVRQAPC